MPREPVQRAAPGLPPAVLPGRPRGAGLHLPGGPVQRGPEGHAGSQGSHGGGRRASGMDRQEVASVTHVSIKHVY